MNEKREQQAPSFFHPIFLYGPPGSGKTSVGKVLAENLALPFVDIDLLIEDQVGMSITQILTIRGKLAFGSMRRQPCARCQKRIGG